MLRIIDTSVDTTAFATTLRQAGVGTVIRCYSRDRSRCLAPPEAQALAAAGLSVAVVYRDRAGAEAVGGTIADLTAATGARDAEKALACAAAIAQPHGTAIYFAVDRDFVKPAEIDSILAYFGKVKAALAGQFRVGVHGSGLVTQAVRRAGLAEFLWLAQSTGWTGYRQALASGHVTLIQKGERIWPGGSFGYDENLPGQGFTDIGAFVPGGAPAPVDKAPHTALHVVTARRGVNLRRGPGTQYDVIRTLLPGTILHGLSQADGWLLADVEGDGQVDGHVASAFVAPVAGGFATAPRIGLSPYAIAREELARDVREVPGAGNNPRIVEYHGSTTGGPGPDSLAWCSSFVNWCVEQAGLRGTDSKWAMSWHADGWGQDVTDAPQPGDIAVFHRVTHRPQGDETGGHVGFLVADEGERLVLLGGNQGNRVSVARYPKKGSLGSSDYALLSIRRALPLDATHGE
ncbi:MAG: TIGR02594 family protein [Paracoccaceae bacterium]